MKLIDQQKVNLYHKTTYSKYVYMINCLVIYFCTGLYLKCQFLRIQIVVYAGTTVTAVDQQARSITKSQFSTHATCSVLTPLIKIIRFGAISRFSIFSSRTALLLVVSTRLKNLKEAFSFYKKNT